MNRREFLKSSLMAACYLGSGMAWTTPRVRAAAAMSQNVFLNLVLTGGPDFRHLFVPPYDDDQNSYGYAYWSHRWKSHAINSLRDDWLNRWEADYTQLSSGGTIFGILNKAGWLKSQFEAGQVAVINNMLASRNRDHAHSLVMLESGDPAAGPNEAARAGWGGRLAGSIQGNVVSMTRQVRLFCNGPHPTYPTSHDNRRVISARDSRNMGLIYPDALKENPSSTNPRAIMARALSSYYQAKKETVAESSTYYKFLQHQEAYREFGESISRRLDSYSIPEEIQALYDGDSRLNQTYFGRQLRNVYDCFAVSDILNFRIGSLEYGGWDSHKRQASDIEPQLEDIFGQGRGLDTLFSVMQEKMPDKYNKMVILISGEFGRQLAANGDQGTDHGRGNIMLAIGPGVKGGIYGEMFPESEIDKYDQPSADIDGLTSIVRLYGAIADWMQSGSANLVFPGLSETDLEPEVDFSSLLST